jgi:hypothetical protein
LVAYFWQTQTCVHQHLRGDTFLLSQQAEQKMLCADVGVIHMLGLFHRVFDDLLGPGRLRELTPRHGVGAA